MSEDIDLPLDFRAFKEVARGNFSFSERVQDPVVVIDKLEHGLVARLGGIVRANGIRRIVLAPSNRHAWVRDGDVIRPLPRDTADVFADLIGGGDASNLKFSDAIQLLRRGRDAAMAVEPSAAFLEAGKVGAESFEGEIAVPGLVAKLFPYQARGVRWMAETIRHTGGLILADEMGLGKTLQVIALLLLHEPAERRPALVICPTSLIANWVRELERFAPHLIVLVHRGPGRTGTYRELQKPDVVITTYDTMVNDISIFSSFEWAWVICDEAQAIKNPESQRRKAVATIPRRRAIPMTGTPVENSLLDLWSLVDFAVPGLLGSVQEFETTYPDSVESAQLLAPFTDPLILRRRVAEVAGDLPERIDVDVPLELEGELAEHYRQVRKHVLAAYRGAGPLVATLQLQMVCAHPWLRQVDEDSEGDQAELVRGDNFPLMTQKLERASDLISEAFSERKKVLVFAVFNRIGDLLYESIGGLGRCYWNAINGGTKQQDRQEIIDAFSAFDGPACLVLNPKAAGAGLNITAATVVIHFTPLWNPAMEAQASARAHRRGQTLPVTVFRLFYMDTVEEVMLERSQWKRDLANESVLISSRDVADLKRALEIEPRRSDEEGF